MAMLEYNPPTDPWIDIVFEDDHILAVNKPSGLLSVPGRLAEHHDSMWSRLQEEYPDIQVVHRLDMSTSGLMVLAKNKRAESALKKQFQFRFTHKIYYARVWGHVEQEEGEIDLPLICDWPNRPLQKVCFEDGKPSKTLFQVAKREEHEDGTKTTIVRLLPITGRSHQLRVHMQALGHPIVGDEFYATEEAKAFSERLELHASELSFYHPKSHWLRSIFVPCDFYPEAEEMIFDYFDPERKLPDYKTLPRP
ncbi:TPA: bifunctional tRNA pseudouridine(32) synthase/23S rRNA pseudouridine(746) synthase RluA [Vibrio parahaemolyticus]|uniref:bifunctional tRNA pseudouridine(32) synthase/23S rRNA pseudouridine(746) synthase RluA n=1 Tax=Vibrio parahaemolyticus TaxID=670 RepID=UPI001121F155|nr:bifunctional tRNA pseudouridine(32) synthase/23S rRNA pseudouridine(746) synthase RluA [Vibrio parahaemolyticus]MDF4940948.1 bifunctional tRNA pseudouridine(32) synthase/23S rRNA pseudouridine(746) synthase RluA [Vibrio parahaemolyticus]TOK34785.1 bifunctional tRNA pseudouridine(32) synthase/ribosomal large subunit pseudouridine synthase RluA [Vibrio parahaemolyticus]HCE3704786.1 bifunctional tRNA pseudouridine(32) synthase/23S rRNA pseudouridine(746) synthase RluA [Vibrio parahaemolyticus]H